MRKSNYITREGWDRLDKELKYLWKEERPKITRSVSEAAAQGDRSENAEYIYGKKRLREIDRRVRFLVKRTEDLTIVYYDPKQEGRVFFGAWVVIENDEGEQLKFKIVGPDEIFGRNDYISIDSPMARALLKKQVDDEAVVTTPAGEKYWTVLTINYL